MSNPAELRKKYNLPENFQPMSSATPRLDVPEKEGFVRRWFRSEPGRIQRAIQAGYQFVDKDDVQLNNFDLGGDAKTDGNSDLGTRVSVISGEKADSTGQPGRLYLMEIPEEVYEYSRGLLEDRNESIAEAIRGGKIGAGHDDESARDQATRYVKGKVPDLFNPKR